MNKSVELIKSEIYEVKSNLQKFTDLSKKEPENEAHSFYVTYFTNRLTILLQIKCELEAWYSIKQGIKLCESKMYEDSYYEYLQFEDELFDESESEDAGERLTPIKKALEVEE